MSRPLEPIPFTEALVSVDTVSARPNEPLIAVLAPQIERLGGRVMLQRRPDAHDQVNLLARFGPEGRGGLALAGHTDTVPWDGTMRATTAPERDGRRMYGRGTCDMKGAIAAMVCAAERTDLRALKKPLWMAFTFQEEIGCLGAKELVHGPPTGLAVDHCIIGEPTGLRPVTRHKGYCIARIHLRGTPCHSSDPTQGASAIHAGARAIDALLALSERWTDPDVDPGELRPPYPTLNIGLFDGGAARNMVPERAAFTIEIRPLPGQDPRDLLAQVEEVARAAAGTVAGVALELEVVETDQPLFTADDEQLVRWLVESTGRDPGTVPFYTEGAFFTELGAKTVICGPGEIAQAHRVDEWVELDALEQATDLYQRAIEEFCA